MHLLPPSLQRAKISLVSPKKHGKGKEVREGEGERGREEEL